MIVIKKKEKEKKEVILFQNQNVLQNWKQSSKKTGTMPSIVKTKGCCSLTSMLLS